MLCGIINTQVRDARLSSAHDDGGDALWPVLSSVVRPDEVLAFTMCNPPFFESLDEAGRNPGTACGGTPAEMVHPGGEVAFISRHVEESRRAEIASRVTWFTTLCGKKATLRAITQQLRAARVQEIGRAHV